MVKKDRTRPKPNPATSKNSTKTEKSKGLAVIPYVEGLSEHIARVFRKHGISTAMKPHRTLRSMLVYPKDKLLPHQKSEAIYEIPCADCPKSYIGETGRSFGTRLQEHQKEVEKFELKPYTRSSRKSSVAEQHNTNQLLQITLFKPITTLSGMRQKLLTLNLTRPPDGSRRPFGFAERERTL